MTTNNAVNTGLAGATGSGNFVGANTPTLITPLLGTPTSGTLTNCTGYPVANIANLGTGVATFLTTPSSANLAAAVTDETGSGALVFGTTPTITTPVFSGVSTGTITAGTYTPTLSNTSNVSASSANLSQYMRVGNVVTVSGVVNVTPTAGTTVTQLRISLPIASDFGGTTEAAGVISSVAAGNVGAIQSENTTDTLQAQWISTGTANTVYAFTATYRIN